MSDPVFQSLAPDQEVVEIQSLCMQCHEQGTSRFLLTKVPHFKDLIISAFECPHCGFHNNEIQSATPISENGVKQSCKIVSQKDLNRQVVISEHASISVPEIELELPSKHEKAYLSTIEGIIRRIVFDLSVNQAERLATEPHVHGKIQDILSFLDDILLLNKVATFVIDDPAGNSYIETLNPTSDPNIETIRYKQTKAQLEEMGYSHEGTENFSEDPESVYTFNSNCHSCNAPCDTKMHLMDIPHFKEVIIMASTCDSCGYKTNEVRSGGAISDHGSRISLKLTETDDLNRDVLKSETCKVFIPEFDVDITLNAIGGRFTTVEGLLRQIFDELSEKIPFFTGDSATEAQKIALDRLLANIEGVIAGSLPCTLILDDPLSNSYVQNLYAPDPDPRLEITTYIRSDEQNDEFGLNDMKVD